MAVKKIEELNIHRDVNSTEQFDVQGYLNENWDKMQDVVDNNAEELMQAQKDISTLKEDNKTNKSSIDVLEKSNETRDEKISKNTEDIEAIQGSIKTATETINKKDNEQDEDIKANKETIKEIQAENERLRNDIKSIAVVNEVSGENIHIEDSSDARCEIEIGGNHQQDTREGYNQLKNEGTTQTLNNVTITKKEDETLVVNGTATEDFTFSIKRNIELEDGEQYKLSGCPNGGAEKKYALTINQYYENQSHFGQDYGDGVNFTYNGSLPINNNIYIRLFKGITYNNLIFKPMIVKGTEQKPYEQYGASPSIDYPSPVKSVGDNINIIPTNSSDWEQGTITNGTNASSMTRIRTKDFIDIIDNEDYYVSIQNIQYCFLNIILYKEDKTYIGQYYSSDNAINGAKYLKINLPTDTKKIRVIIRKIDNISNISPIDIEIIKPKLEKSSVATLYSSYNCGSAKVDIVNKNIFKEISNKKDIKQAYFNIISGILNIKKGEIYIISFDTNNNQGELYLNEDIFSFQGGYSVTCDGKRHYLIGKAKDQINTNVTILKTKKETTNNYDISNVLVTKYDASNVDTKYIKHQEQSYLVDVQQPMFENDTFMKQDAKWYEKHNWKTMSFDGQNMGSQAGGNFADFKENGNIVRVFEIKDLLISSVRNDIFCDKLPRQADSMWNGKSTGIQSWQGQNKILISLPFDDVEKKYGQKLTVDNYVTAFYMYLQDEVPIISYPLAEPKLLECTETQSKVLDEIYNKAHTYKNITNISAELSEVNPIVSLKYLKDVETEHNKLQAQIDEIKQLLSTTETSAMLLNNMQTDLESEV